MGNGLALLGITTVVCEVVLMNFIKVSYIRKLCSIPSYILYENLAPQDYYVKKCFGIFLKTISVLQRQSLTHTCKVFLYK